jgi:hypothetical protein
MANDISSLLILFTLMIDAIISPETSVFKRATWRPIPEDGILQLFSISKHAPTDLSRFFLILLEVLIYEYV